MREVVLQMQVSIDGFVGAGDGGLDWIFPNFDDEYAAWGVEKLWEAGVHIMGAGAGRDMAAHWPHSIEPYAAPMNAIPKVIFSRTLAAVEWDGASINRGELATEVERLKRQPGKAVLAHGGASFAQALTRLGLVDEYRLIVHPVALGEGLPLFPALPRPMTLQLREQKTFDTGVTVNVYRRN